MEIKKKNTHSNGNEYVSLYLITSINWHAKLAGLPLVKKDNSNFSLVHLKPKHT